jgi:hypothetical protein
VVKVLTYVPLDFVPLEMVSAPALTDVTLWERFSVHVHVTLSPGATVTVVGENVLLVVRLTFVLAAKAAGACAAHATRHARTAAARHRTDRLLMHPVVDCLGSPGSSQELRWTYVLRKSPRRGLEKDDRYVARPGCLVTRR